MLAAQNGHKSTAGLLLDRGADVEARDIVSGGVVDPCPRRRSGVAASATGGVCVRVWLSVDGCGQWSAGSVGGALRLARSVRGGVSSAGAGWRSRRGSWRRHGLSLGLVVCRPGSGAGGGRGWRAGAGHLGRRAWRGVRMCVLLVGWRGARVAAVADGGVWGAAAGAMAGGRDEARGCGRRRVVCVLGIVLDGRGVAVCRTGWCVGGGHAVAWGPGWRLAWLCVIVAG